MKLNRMTIQEQINSPGVIITTVDEEIMKKMPTSTTTFVERGIMKSLINRIYYFLRTGK